MITRFLAIVGNTFLETIRQPLFGVILLVTALMFILNIGLAGFTLADDDKLLMDLGLSTLLLSGLFLSVFSATGVLTREIENKTVLTVISKPVSRPLFLVGKYAGVLLALMVALYLCSLMFLMMMRHQVLQNSTDPWDGPVLVFGFGALFLTMAIAAFLNYFFGTEFASAAVALGVGLMTLAAILIGFWNKTWEAQPFGESIFSIQLIYSVSLIALAVAVLAAIALAVSTRLSQVMTLLVCVLFTMAGLVSDFVLGQHANESAVADTLYKILPNLGIYSVLDAVTAGRPIPGSYVATVAAYSGLMAISILSLGVIAFQRREVG